MLKVKDLKIFYGSIEALKGISLTVNEGEIVTVLGANGAGKSTLLRAISGLLPIHSGEIKLDDEGRKVFATLTVDENLNLGAYTRRKDKKNINESKKKVYDLFPILKARRNQLSGTLSGGEQQMLAMGRGLMSTPRILLLDEPSLGLAPLLVKQIFQIIREINDQGISILLVEQNARKALGIADRGYVLETGNITISGLASELKSNKKVQEAYLGGAALKKRK
ncbi:ABC transporter ATP-binding protein [Candidatus Atribacteria bacterium HGW-Atribacteria-1]|nr:MAG: ABC transporter ATP-binding protein [Candidatus Atribacteria bacterium HGW-Atribacteria-1]